MPNPPIGTATRRNWTARSGSTAYSRPLDIGDANMRSPLLIAALAASALATSLATADAAPLRHHAAPAQNYTQRFTNPFQPMPLLGDPFDLSTSGNPYLAQIQSQLNQTERTINADRRRGYIT